MYPKWMHYILKYFDFWGFHTEFHSNGLHQKSTHFILCIRIVIGIIGEVAILKYIDRLQDDVLGTINDYIKLHAMQISYWAPIIESYTQRKQQQTFWKILREIDTKYCSRRTFELKNYIYKFILFPLMFILSNWRFSLFFYGDGSEYLVFRLTYTFMSITCQNRIFYNLFYMELIKSELKTINLDIKRMNRICSNEGNGLYEAFELKRLKWARQYHALIHHLCIRYNTVLGWSNTVSILIQFLYIFADTNWTYWKWFNEFDDLYIFGSSSIAFCDQKACSR